MRIADGEEVPIENDGTLALARLSWCHAGRQSGRP